MAYLDLQNLQCVLLDDEALRARKLTRRRCGILHITSGFLVACDPLVQPERQAFVRRVKMRGEFPVEVLQDSHHALAVLWLRDRAACATMDLRWEPALLDGEELENLSVDEYFGYPVDAGVGCFMDAEAAAAMAEREAHHAENGDDDFNYYDSVLAEEMGDDAVADHYPLGADTPNNMVIFRSGWGDGYYPTYWALDTNGDPVALVTDFMTIHDGDARSDEEKQAEVYLASLSPEKLAALEALDKAVGKGDVEAIRALLAGGLAGRNDIIPSSGETAISSAIRLDKTEALRVLLGNAGCPDMPEQLHMKKVKTYLELAHFYTQPRSPALVALLDGSAVNTATETKNVGSGDAIPPAPKLSFWRRWFK